jgi:hypothetical protein
LLQNKLLRNINICHKKTGEKGDQRKRLEKTKTTTMMMKNGNDRVKLKK